MNGDRNRNLILVILILIVLLLGCFFTQLGKKALSTLISRSGIAAFETQSTPAATPTTSFIIENQPEVTWYAADTPYEDLGEGEWTGPFTCTGPAVCEWWIGSGAYFGLEGFVLLREGETVEFPAGYVGHAWKIPAGNSAIERLRISYRHLLFYSNILTPQSLETIKGYFWDWPKNPPVKTQHSYMAQWLIENGHGPCNFYDQAGCAALEPKVVVPPSGVVIKTP